jgi:hypothetical protein
MIPGVFARVDASQKYAPEAVYFAALELLHIVENVLSLPTEHNFRAIDLESDTWLRRLKPIEELQEILTFLRFKPHAHAPFLIMGEPDIPQLEAAAIDLRKEVTRRENSTPVAKGVRALVKKNGVERAALLMEKVQPALQRVAQEPHEQKYHKILLDKLYAKSGVLSGGNDLLKALGFTIDVVGNAAFLQYPGFDADLLKLRAEELQRAWSRALEAEQARRDAA